MSDTQLIALKLDMKRHIDALNVLCNTLVNLVKSLGDIERRLFAIEKDKLGAWKRMDIQEAVERLSIFSKFTYGVDQNPKESVKLPAVIQLNPTDHKSIYETIIEINAHKDALEKINQMLKVMLKKGSAEVWQDMMRYLSIIQLLRHISVLSDRVTYLGLSYMTKPVVKSMTKDVAIKYIDNKIKYYLNHASYLSKVPFLDEVKRQIEMIDEQKFEIKMARKGSPRVMLNTKSSNGQRQIMASLPVFVFSEDVIQVSKPSGLKRKSRSDKRIPLGEIKSDFGIYMIPKRT
jgi:hypothetical protein